MSVEVDILPIADDNAETARLADLIEREVAEGCTGTMAARRRTRALDQPA